MVKKIKHVVLNRRTPPPLCSSPFQGDSWMVATNDDPTIGTQENPYTLEEFNSLVLIGEWPGGWVEFFGFVPWNLEDWYGSFSSSDSDCTSSSEEEINPGDGDDGLGHGGNEDENGENKEEENQNGNQGNGNDGGGNGNPSDNTRCLIRTIFNHTACDGPILSGYTCMIHSHPNGAEASDIDRHVAYQYSKHNYVYFAIYDSKKHILRSYQPFNDYEESIWKQNH